MVDLRELSITVVVPAYNEERRIISGLRAIDSFLTASGSKYDIVVVDDGSTDKTAETVEALIAGMPSVRLLRALRSGKRLRLAGML